MQGRPGARSPLSKQHQLALSQMDIVLQGHQGVGPDKKDDPKISVKGGGKVNHGGGIPAGSCSSGCRQE